MLKFPIYADYNATTPVDKLVLEAMLPYFTQHFGNAASRGHIMGLDADEAIINARKQVANLIGATDKEIIFTSGATESINLALKGVFSLYRTKGNHIITVQTAHKAVLESCEFIEKMGGEVTYLPVDKNGLVSPAVVEAAMKPTTILVALLHANNETGVIQPLREISKVVHRHGAIVFSDAAQAIGKIKIQVDDDGIDLMAISAHKIYGPKGVGALYIRRKNPRVTLAPQIHGGGHERGLRSGTQNVPGIVGLGHAAMLCGAEMKEESLRLAALRARLEKGLLEIPRTFINGKVAERLTHVTNICFEGIDSGTVLNGFNRKIAISTGSACSSALPSPSHVLQAMGLTAQEASASFRFSLGRFSTEEEVDYIVEQVQLHVGMYRAQNPAWDETKGKIIKDAAMIEK